ncbi:hypothetical protein Nepgr_008045 [Nepenthes gracilis]|uniref:Uncharacterized protein n=1 Tax=Nepenthes gracilis TaxID=150966 RepID=A0AAD3S878_NEPGR|nr:hypothetical protein Nepgr_008045 [Nepenthes gracilis]
MFKNPHGYGSYNNFAISACLCTSKSPTGTRIARIHIRSSKSATDNISQEYLHQALYCTSSKKSSLQLIKTMQTAQEVISEDNQPSPRYHEASRHGAFRTAPGRATSYQSAKDPQSLRPLQTAFHNSTTAHSKSKLLVGPALKLDPDARQVNCPGVACVALQDAPALLMIVELPKSVDDAGVSQGELDCSAHPPVHLIAELPLKSGNPDFDGPSGVSNITPSLPESLSLGSERRSSDGLLAHRKSDCPKEMLAMPPQSIDGAVSNIASASSHSYDPVFGPPAVS